jgi:hypothetical protein
MTTHAQGIKVSITLEVIEESIRRDSSHCMVAQAIKSAIPDATNITVDIQTIRYSNKKARERRFYLTPRAVQQKLVDFDIGKPIEPFSFMLRSPHVVPMNISAPQEANRQGVQTQPKQDRKGRRTRELQSTTSNKSWPVYKIGRRRQFGLRALQP